MNAALRVLQAERRAIELGSAELYVGEAGPHILELRAQVARELQELDRAIALLWPAARSKQPRDPVAARRPLNKGEIEPGRYVPVDWDRSLFEPYAARKARRAAELRA